MLVDEIKDLSLGDMKRVAKELNIASYASVATKAKMLEKIDAKIEELGLTEIPDLAQEVEEEIKSTVEAKKASIRYIRDHPKIKCVIETRDDNEIDLAIGINEYTAMIQFGKEIDLPEPVYNMIKGLTMPKFVKDENGFTRTETINKYIVSKV